MILTCEACHYHFDDKFRTTICPHEPFAANDGRNNFAHHPESFLAPANRIADAATEYADKHCPTAFDIPGLTRETKLGIISGVKALLREAYIAGREKGNA